MDGLQRRGFLALTGAAAVGVAGGLAGCSDSSSGSSSSFRLAWYGSSLRTQKYNKICDLYEKQNPDAKITRQGATEGAYWDRLAAQSVAKSEPDVLHFTNMQLKQYAGNGVLLDLNQQVKAGKLNVKDVDKELITSGTIDGKFYNYPTGLLVICTVLNQGLLERAGVQLPGAMEEWTWDDFIAMGKSAAPKLPKGSYFCGDFGGASRIFSSWLRGRGKLLFDASGTKLAFEKNDLADWLTMWQQLRDAKLIPTPSEASQDSGAFEDQFFAHGRTAVYLHVTNMVSNFQPFVKDKVVIRRIPREKSADGNVDYFFSVGMAVSARSKSTAAATKFVDFFMNNAEAAKIFQEEFGPPASSAMQDAVKSSLPASKLRELEFTQAMQKLGSLRADQIFPAGADTVNSEILGKANQDVGFGRSKVAAAVDEFFQQASKVINNGK